MTKLISFIVSFILLVESLPLVWVPVLTIDAADRGDRTGTYATGFLYGLSEPEVPSSAMTNSLHISSVSQKVIGGLQHPTGDIDRVSSQLDGTDYRVVYLQDCFDTWYYCHDEIMQLRQKGTYDWETFIKERYLPTVEEKVRELSEKDYADDLVYCLYNECDNAVWFGTYKDGSCHYDDEGRESFYKAWKMTYDLVRSIDPDSKIGGPGFCDYETSKIRGFMEYTSENSCVPDIIIYHELAFWCCEDWYAHVEDYRKIEDDCKITADLPIIVTEYGTMEECGNPLAMMRYIIAMEDTNTYGNMAFWRLANNLNDTCADYNSPNSNWWLYRKYAQMEGTSLSATASAAKTEKLYDNSWWFRYKGLATLRDNEEEINIICNGSDNKKAVRLINLDETKLGATVDVTVECVYYSGLTGIVNEPLLLRQYTAKPSFGKLNINIPGTDTDSVYFITVKKHTGNIDTVRNTNIPVRYEFEEGTLLGDAYTYDSAYATTGEEKGMCGGNEKEGDGVRITVKAKEDGLYRLELIYGKCNDGSESGDRDYAVANLKIDSDTTELLLENTIKSEYTTSKVIEVYLEKGRHTIELTHNKGTFVADSLIMSKATQSPFIYLLPDSEDSTAYLAVAPEDGYYVADTKRRALTALIDGAECTVESGSQLYLRRGLNEIKLSDCCELTLSEYKGEKTPLAAIEAEDFTLSEGACLKTDKYGNNYIDSINALSGKAQFTLNVPEAGDYRVTLLYANNSEGGYHAYNVDLIERYVTVSVNGEADKDIYCRSTYSDYTYKTLTFNLYLNQGENTLSLTNSGSSVFGSILPEAPLIKSITVNSPV